MTHRSVFQQSLRPVTASVICLLLLWIAGCGPVQLRPDCNHTQNSKLRLIVQKPEDTTRKADFEMGSFREILKTALSQCKSFAVLDATDTTKSLNDNSAKSSSVFVLRAVVTGYDQKYVHVTIFSEIWDWIRTKVKEPPKPQEPNTIVKTEFSTFKIDVDLKIVDPRTQVIVAATSVRGKGTSSISHITVHAKDHPEIVLTTKTEIHHDLEATLRTAMSKAIEDLATHIQASRRAS